MKNRSRLHVSLALAGVVLAVPLLGYAVGRVVTGRLAAGLVGAVETALGARVEARRISVTSTLQLELEGVRLIPADGDAPIAEVKRAVIYPQLFPRSKKSKINAVILEHPLLYIRAGEDGALNIGRWVDAFANCGDLSAMEGFPNRIIVRDGAALILSSGGEEDGAAIIEDIQGEAGKTVTGGVVVGAAGTGPAGAFSLKGKMSPCAGGGVDIAVKSDRWDFDASMLQAMKWLGGGAPSGKPNGKPGGIRAGAGKLDARVFGGPGGVMAEGKIRAGRRSARFSLSRKELALTDLTTRVAGGRARGGGTVRFDRANLPVRMSFTLEDVAAASLLRGLLGFQFAPRAKLDGYLKMNGSMNEPGSLILTGGVESGRGTIRLPPLDFGKFRGRGNLTIPFEKFTARVSREGGETRVYTATLAGRAFAARGAANFGGGLLNLEGADSGGAYSASFVFDIADIGELLARNLGKNVLGGGPAKGEIRVEGTAGRSLRGAGKLSASGGWLANPYADPSYYGGAERLTFDTLTAEFSFTGNSLRLTRCKLDGEGLHIEVGGEIGPGGELRFDGRAMLSSEVARNFTGLWRALDRREMAEASAFDAPFTIRGTVGAPEMEWGTGENSSR